MWDEFVCEARVTFRGKTLHLNKLIAKIELNEIVPDREPSYNPFDMIRSMERHERRQRLVDTLAAEFAYTLTEALYKEEL